MRIKTQTATAEELKARAVELLGYGVLPFEQWAHVFANPKLDEWPGLKAKAFSVWFPTMIDFLQGSDEVSAIASELMKRQVETESLFELIERLKSSYQKVLSLYSSDEQLFIRDRRLQNVHGRLQIYMLDEHEVTIYDGKSGLIKRSLDAKNYRELMQNYYSDLSGNSARLIERLVKSTEFKELSELYFSKLKFQDHFAPLIEKLGVSVACGFL